MTFKLIYYRINNTPEVIFLPDISRIDRRLFEETVIESMVPRDVVSTNPGRDVVGSSSHLFILMSPLIARDLGRIARGNRRSNQA